jgi:ABC-type multidrug transport system fused ATPase/permease subunit
LLALLRWVMSYALRRWLALAAVILALLSKVALDVLKPWPMLCLVDYVLQTKAMPAWVARLIESLPGPHTPNALIGWSVGATVALFLLGWAAGLAQTCAGISLGPRMVYELAADVPWETTSAASPATARASPPSCATHCSRPPPRV